jgi:hypothetical protein
MEFTWIPGGRDSLATSQSDILNFILIETTFGVKNVKFASSQAASHIRDSDRVFLMNKSLKTAVTISESFSNFFESFVTASVV